MKRLFLSLTAAATLCGAASAQTLSVADVEALPGETVSYTLTIDVQGGDYKGFQYQMTFPATGFATAGTTVVSADWDGASFSVGDLDAVGQANASAYSSSDTSIPDGEMVIGTVKFTVDEGVATGDYDVTISDFNFLDGTNYVPVADVTFKVSVVERHTIVLDENATALPEAADGVNVRVLRTISAGNWSSICLPFAMTEAQVKAAFGEDVQLADFTGAEVDGDDNICVNFSSVAAMEANHPYIIKVGSDVTEFTADGVDISPEEEPAVDCDEETTGSGRNKKTTYNSFIGTYVAETVVPDFGLFLSGNKFWFSTGNTVMKAFRAYFDLATAGADYTTISAANIQLNVADDEASDVREIEDGKWKTGTGVYDLQGRRVESSIFNSQSSILKKGLYIKDGRKVIVK